MISFLTTNPFGDKERLFGSHVPHLARSTPATHSLPISVPPCRPPHTPSAYAQQHVPPPFPSPPSTPSGDALRRRLPRPPCPPSPPPLASNATPHLAVRRHVRLGASQLHAQPKVHHLGNHAGGVGGARLEHHVGGPVWERKCGAWYDGADEGGGRRELWGLTPQPLHLLRPPHT
eukprot:363683-Chlamydomonas_euryale.AAC.9